MSMVLYNCRVDLNPPESHFTGSMACFDGKNVINQGKMLERYSFVEVSSCHGKTRIHNDANLPFESYINKIDLMIKELTAYSNYLKDSLPAAKEKPHIKPKTIEEFARELRELHSISPSLMEKLPKNVVNDVNSLPSQIFHY